MTQEDKELLLKDLCARLPYGVKISFNGYNQRTLSSIRVIGDDNECEFAERWGWHVIDDDIKPYLRPMSSMTEEEKKELVNHVLGGKGTEFFHVTEDGSIDGNQEAEQELYNFHLHWLNFDQLTTSRYIDWLNAHHFDYRGLIPKGLANSTEKFNPYKD